jgi:hypothetical protein
MTLLLNISEAERPIGKLVTPSSCHFEGDDLLEIMQYIERFLQG